MPPYRLPALYGAALTHVRTVARRRRPARFQVEDARQALLDAVWFVELERSRLDPAEAWRDSPETARLREEQPDPADVGAFLARLQEAGYVVEAVDGYAPVRLPAPGRPPSAYAAEPLSGEAAALPGCIALDTRPTAEEAGGFLRRLLHAFRRRRAHARLEADLLHVLSIYERLADVEFGSIDLVRTRVEGTDRTALRAVRLNPSPRRPR